MKFLSIVVVSVLMTCQVASTAVEQSVVSGVEGLSSLDQTVRASVPDQVAVQRHRTAKIVIQFISDDSADLVARNSAIIIAGQLRLTQAISPLLKNLEFRTFGELQRRTIGGIYPAAGALMAIGYPVPERIITSFSGNEPDQRVELLAYILKAIDGPDIAASRIIAAGKADAARSQVLARLLSQVQKAE